MAMKQKTFEGLAEAIRETGLFLKDNAEALVPNVKFLRCMTIRVEFNPEEIPAINVDYDAISLEAVEAWRKSHE